MYQFLKKFGNGKTQVDRLTLSDNARREDIILGAVILAIESNCEVWIIHNGNYFDRVRKPIRKCELCNN